MENGLFIIGREKLNTKKDGTEAVYIQMILERMQNKNRMKIQANRKTNYITEKILELITRSTGWIVDSKQEKTKEGYPITEYIIRRTPAIEIKEK